MEAKKLISPTTMVKALSDLMCTRLEIETSIKSADNKFTLDNFNQSVKHIMEYMFVSPRRLDWVDDISSLRSEYISKGMPLIFFNNKFKDKRVENIRLIEFHSLYPNIITKLIRSGNISFNYKEFSIIYPLLLDTKDMLAGCDDEWWDDFIKGGGVVHDRKELYKLTKILLNFVYGACFNSRSIIHCTDISMVTEHIFGVYSRIFNKYGDHIVYIDTDQIWVLDGDHLSDIKCMADFLGVPYDVDSEIFSIYAKGVKRCIVYNFDGTIR